VCGCPDTSHTNASEHLCDETGGDVWTSHLSLHPHTYSAGVASTVQAHTRVVPKSTSLFPSAMKWGHALWAPIDIPDDVGVELLVKLMCDLFWGSKVMEKVFVPGGDSIKPFVFIPLLHKVIPNPLFLRHPSTHPCYCPPLRSS